MPNYINKEDNTSLVLKQLELDINDQRYIDQNKDIENKIQGYINNIVSSKTIRNYSNYINFKNFNYYLTKNLFKDGLITDNKEISNFFTLLKKLHNDKNNSSIRLINNSANLHSSSYFYSGLLNRYHRHDLEKESFSLKDLPFFDKSTSIDTNDNSIDKNITNHNITSFSNFKKLINEKELSKISSALDKEILLKESEFLDEIKKNDNKSNYGYNTNYRAANFFTLLALKVVCNNYLLAVKNKLLPEINFNSYNPHIKEVESIKENIDNCYLLIKDEAYLTLSKTRHTNRSMFEWALTKDINKAFVFSGNYSDYSINYDIKTLNIVYVNVDIKNVVVNKPSSLSSVLSSKIERKQLENINKKDKINKLLEKEELNNSPVVKKVHKL